jgi:hypothetical protein
VRTGGWCKYKGAVTSPAKEFVQRANQAIAVLDAESKMVERSLRSSRHAVFMLADVDEVCKSKQGRS